MLLFDNPVNYEIDIRRRAAFEHVAENQSNIALGLETRRVDDPKLLTVMNSLRTLSIAHFGIDIIVLAFEPGTITLTTSGKLERMRLARRVESGEVQPRLQVPQVAAFA